MDDSRHQLVKDIIAQLVPDPDDAVVEVLVHSQGVIYEVVVPDQCMGRVLGKEGRTINAVRMIMTACWARDKKSVRVNLVQNDNVTCLPASR